MSYSLPFLTDLEFSSAFFGNHFPIFVSVTPSIFYQSILPHRKYHDRKERCTKLAFLKNQVSWLTQNEVVFRFVSICSPLRFSPSISLAQKGFPFAQVRILRFGSNSVTFPAGSPRRRLIDFQTIEKAESLFWRRSLPGRTEWIAVQSYTFVIWDFLWPSLYKSKK